MGSSRRSAGVSGGYSASARKHGIESSFCKAGMARSASPIRVATRERISIGCVPYNASLSIGTRVIPFSTRAKAAVLSPSAMLISARSSISRTLSGCSLKKDSSSLRACRQVFWAAAWSPAASCAQPNQKHSSPLKKPARDQVSPVFPIGTEMFFNSVGASFSNRASKALRIWRSTSIDTQIPPALATCSMREAMFTPSP